MCYAKWGVAGLVGILWMGLAAGLLAVEQPAAQPTLAPVKPNDSQTAHPLASPHSPATSAPTGEGIVDAGKVELVTERYPNGKVKIEREVGQDAAGNYINQGSYKIYNPARGGRQKRRVPQRKTDGQVDAEVH